MIDLSNQTILYIMTISKLIEVLQKARNDYGDIPVMIPDGFKAMPITVVARQHPFNDECGYYDSGKPVEHIVLKDWIEADGNYGCYAISK